MTFDARLSRLMQALTAKERAILVLQAWQAGTEEDPDWRSSIPASQAREFNQLIDLMNASVLRVGRFITSLEHEVDKLELRAAWLESELIRTEHVRMLRRLVRLAVREPITENDYQAKQAELDGAWIPLNELAEVLASHHDWSEADFEPAEDEEEPDVTEAAWARVLADSEQRLRAAVASGTLAERVDDGEQCIQEGSFNCWGGLATSPVPEYWLAFRVVPDATTKSVAAELAGLRRLEVALQPDSLSDLNRLRGAIAESFRELWAILDAVEAALAEVAEQFEGIDPLLPASRETLDNLHARMTALVGLLASLDVHVEQRSPTEEHLELVRRLAGVYA